MAYRLHPGPPSVATATLDYVDPPASTEPCRTYRADERPDVLVTFDDGDEVEAELRGYREAVGVDGRRHVLASVPGHHHDPGHSCLAQHLDRAVEQGHAAHPPQHRRLE